MRYCLPPGVDFRRCRSEPVGESLADSTTLEQEVQSLRDRLFRLRAASLRINESLDFEAVLQGVLEGAQAVTDARYGVISLVDDAERLQDIFVSGFNPEAYRRVVGPCDGPSVVDWLSGLSELLRVGNFFDHASALGFPEFRLPPPLGSNFALLAAPICHQGKRVGHICLLEKDGGPEFTPEDEEVLVMIASHVALVISNSSVRFNAGRSGIGTGRSNGMDSNAARHHHRDVPARHAANRGRKYKGRFPVPAVSAVSRAV